MPLYSHSLRNETHKQSTTKHKKLSEVSSSDQMTHRLRFVASKCLLVNSAKNSNHMTKYDSIVSNVNLPKTTVIQPTNGEM
ncbi:CLUMA_CG000294, isoform A [Clunio marinus]|uniref:CLUMA_CG000294, isoform A n=1 Tax=Clunio marinus TaxID=568069 RepID=A0A1J1HFC2_9DIPT|nr:CLUMA_CG000294, isoform A [Clunio marinus]